MSWHIDKNTEIGIFMIGIIITSGIGIVGWVLPIVKSSQNTDPNLQNECFVFNSTGCSAVFQNGAQSVIFSAGTDTSSATITFSPAFSRSPDYISAELLNFPSIVTTISTSYAQFLAVGPTGVTWTNMPVTVTELFGSVTPCCRVLTSLSGTSGCTFTATYSTASTGVGAYLDVQYSTDQITWASIDNNLNHLSITGVNTSAHSTTQFAVPTASQASFVYLRVVGANGGGVGDVPTFSNLSLFCFAGVRGIYTTISGITSTGFTINARTALIQMSGITVTFLWEAWLCKPFPTTQC